MSWAGQLGLETMELPATAVQPHVRASRKKAESPSGRRDPTGASGSRPADSAPPQPEDAKVSAKAEEGKGRRSSADRKADKERRQARARQLERERQQTAELRAFAERNLAEEVAQGGFREASGNLSSVGSGSMQARSGSWL